MAKKKKVNCNSSNGIKFTFTITFKKSFRAGCSTFEGNINAKKSINNAKNFKYLTLDAKHAFNYLLQAFPKVFIFQHLDLKSQI